MGRLVEYLGAVRTVDFSLALLTSGLITWWLLPGQMLSLPLIGFACRYLPSDDLVDAATRTCHCSASGVMV